IRRHADHRHDGDQHGTEGGAQDTRRGGELTTARPLCWAKRLIYALYPIADLGHLALLCRPDRPRRCLADAMNRPWWRISLEMRHQRFYYFIQQGKTSALVVYVAAPENQDWAVVNSIRSPISKLNIAPYGKHCVAQDRLQQPASRASSIADKQSTF